MLKLHVIQAEYGDCFLLEFGSGDDEPHYALIDGGPANTYERHLRPAMDRFISRPGVLDLVILSHVDNDHTIGLLDFLADMRDNPDDVRIEIGELWHNTFERGEGDDDIRTRLNSLMAHSSAASVMTAAGLELAYIGEGENLDRFARLLQIPVNTSFANNLVCVDDAPAPQDIANLSLRVVGPTRVNLDKLRTKWLEWLDENEADIDADVYIMANRDRSVPNLSSIMVLAEADDKRILFTGDGRSDHLLQGLATAQLLDDEEMMHVDVLKVAHHGSDRNANKTFFRKVTAAQYIMSANGKDDNPDLATLIWIVEAAASAQREIEILVTNETLSTQQLLENYPSADYGYSISLMPPTTDSMTITLAD